ncbi:MAG: type II toxin-antitoxin system RelE/ParE family toxin [Alishewanella agri]|nr:type II toxin-antitoxin system RelE/ParE family toxin [Alishewanella agri]
MRYKLSNLAQVHLQGIKTYTVENYSDAQWQKYKTTLLNALQLLAESPDVGRSCADIYPNGYFFPVGKHMAYFTKEADFILIVAILGQPQLPQNHLK